MRWQHSRKGIIEGTIVGRDDEWVDIELSTNDKIGGAGNPNFAPQYGAGDVLRVREGFLTELPALACSCPTYGGEDFDGMDDYAAACAACPVHGTAVPW